MTVNTFCASVVVGGKRMPWLKITFFAFLILSNVHLKCVFSNNTNNININETHVKNDHSFNVSGGVKQHEENNKVKAH